MAYISGVADTTASGGVIRGLKNCRHTHVTVQQLGDVVVQFLQKHPELRHHAASYLVAQALSESFPCK